MSEQEIRIHAIQKRLAALERQNERQNELLFQTLELLRQKTQPKFSDWKDADDWIFSQLDFTKEELDRLDEIEGRFQAQIEAGNLTELAELDVEFHDTIYKATNNQRLVQLLNNLREQMYRYRVEYLKDIAVRRTLAEEHRSICEALRAGDETKALDYIRVHIDNQQKAIIRGLNQDNE